MDLNGNAPVITGGFSLGTFPIRAPHDSVSLSRRARGVGEDFGLQADDVRRLSAATYETARLLVPRDGLEAEIRLADGPSLEVVFRVLLGSDGERAELRARVAPGVAALKPLVHALLIEDTPEGLSIWLRLLFQTGEVHPVVSLPSETVAPDRAADVELFPDRLRDRYAALQQHYRDLLVELQETNSGVVALYAELENQADRLREAEERLRRRAEDLAAANRAKEDFLATLSHELRTPLNAMLGWTRLLRTGKLDAASTDRALETIERNARAQEQLVADILDVSRIVTGRLRVELSTVPLGPIVSAALDAVRPAAEAKGIELRSEIASAGSVLGDSARLQQVLWNLLVNAIKFTPRGGEVTVSVDVRGPNTVITVSDSGEGIPDDLLPFIFDRFRQGDSSVTRPYGGLGLGLSIVRHIVELHGGKVHAWSAGKGQGATFSVHLPLNQ